MRKDHRRRDALLAVAALIAAVAGLGWSVARPDGGDRDAAAGQVAIVDAPAPRPRALPPPAAARPRAPAAMPTPADAIARVRRAYPLLSDVSLACDGRRCSFRATIPPPTGQADLDKRQELLLGGLASTLAADGYAMSIPVRMNEVDDNLFHLEAAVTGPDRPIG